MKKLFAVLLAVLMLTTLLACHPSQADNPNGEGLFPVVTHPSDTAPTEPSRDTHPTIPSETVPSQGTMPSAPGEDVPVPEDPTSPENNQDK